jgi:hypothetical protein
VSLAPMSVARLHQVRVPPTVSPIASPAPLSHPAVSHCVSLSPRQVLRALQRFLASSAPDVDDDDDDDDDALAQQHHEQDAEVGSPLWVPLLHTVRGQLQAFRGHLFLHVSVTLALGYREVTLNPVVAPLPLPPFRRRPARRRRALFFRTATPHTRRTPRSLRAPPWRRRRRRRRGEEEAEEAGGGVWRLWRRRGGATRAATAGTARG